MQAKTTAQLADDRKQAIQAMQAFYQTHENKWTPECQVEYERLCWAFMDANRVYQERLRQEAEAGRSFQPPQATNSFRWDF